MSKSKRLFEETRQDQPDYDKQYFEWLSNEEWQAELVKAEKRLRDKYGYTVTYTLKWGEFLTKNHMR